MDFTYILIYALVFASIGLLSYYFVPWFMKKVQEREKMKLKKTSQGLEEMFVNVSSQKLRMFSLAAVIAGALFGFMFFKLIGAIAGALFGFLLPYFFIKFKKKQRRAKFLSQLVDAIIVLNSCLKAGLSFNQALGMVSSDMAAPISDEFDLVAREIHMGSSLEEALLNLDKRINAEELRFVISAVLVARQVGGDLPSVLSRLVITLRDRFRLKENIKTYTIQGRAQGYIISCIPIVFLFIMLQRNPHHFDIMFATELGKILLAIAVILNTIGIFLIIKLSKIKI